MSLGVAGIAITSLYHLKRNIQIVIGFAATCDAFGSLGESKSLDIPQTATLEAAR